MARINIDLPATFTFATTISVRVSDINYGGHMGNDALLSILHEARMQFLQKSGYSELDVAGKSLIMADVAIAYKGEAFRGDMLTIQVAAQDFNKYGFDVVYEVKNQDLKLIALAKTGMVCFNYQNRTMVSLPVEVEQKLSGF
ncbi:thioesterase family protein [Adhaeribacter aquaticus]|uniref:thioesterase family protein n=1 Tax=Adhaeribacter aquaticus TaxID=299567 RepID=UPI0003FD2233|nr:thioesterase family protein [Adhaeribacter aquaticus]